MTKPFLTFENERINMSDCEPIVVFPARCNPPTIGHRHSIRSLKSLSKRLNATPVVLIVDTGKYGARNPLPGDIRQQYLEKVFPDVKYFVSKNSYVGIYDLYKCQNMLTIGDVCGSDREGQYKKIAVRIFGSELEEIYCSNVIERNDTEGLSGISATMARRAADENDFPEFKRITGFDTNTARKLMIQVRLGIGV